MSVTVSAVLPSVFQIAGAPSHEVEISQDEAIHLVTAVDAAPNPKADFLEMDDVQYGYYAIRVNPKGFADVVKALSAEFQEKICAHVKFAVAHDLGISVETNDDRAHHNVKPTLRLSTEAMDDPQVQWTASHAIQTFRNVGLTYDSQNPRDFGAQELLTACEARLDKVSDPDTLRLLKIATYALAKAGRDARVMAA